MINFDTVPAILVLEDGRSFQGSAFGSEGETSGEVCFNTGFCGYQEILTDPSYCRQLVTLTSPHIGNYGINGEDAESDRIQVAGLIIREESTQPSNWRSRISIGDYLREHAVVGISGLDTRALTRHIRRKGAMNGIISTIDLDLASLRNKLKSVPVMTGLNLVREVTCESAYDWVDQIQKARYFSKIVTMDFGLKSSIARLLAARGCVNRIVPAETTAEDILALNPAGILLSNGPGDPAAVDYAVQTIDKLIGKVPIFGICLGHQILALALGAKTYKLKFGHRGSNHPVKNLSTGKVEITSQNHGFAVDGDTLPSDVEISHINLNDQTVEGLVSRNQSAFSVQYHPEAGPGPHDSFYLFDQFIALINDYWKGQPPHA